MCWCNIRKRNSSPPQDLCTTSIVSWTNGTSANKSTVFRFSLKMQLYGIIFTNLWPKKGFQKLTKKRPHPMIRSSFILMQSMSLKKKARDMQTTVDGHFCHHFMVNITYNPTINLFCFYAPPMHGSLLQPLSAPSPNTPLGPTNELPLYRFWP